MPDKEGLAKIVWNLTDQAFDIYTRSYTGGLPVYRTVVDVVSGKKDRKAVQNIKTHKLQEMRFRMERLEALSFALGFCGFCLLLGCMRSRRM